MHADPEMHLTLASRSPRRAELLSLTGWRFTTGSSATEEIAQDGEEPASMAQRLARAKAWGAAERARSALVLAADTLVVDRGQPLGKPSSAAEAHAMLMALRGRKHFVVTSIALVDLGSNREVLETCVSQVAMRRYQESEVDDYIAAGSPMDKAGAYGIQDRSFDPVEMGQMEDCYANVMGLPLCHVVRAMEKLGHRPATDIPAACQAHTGYNCRVHDAILGWER